MSRRLTVAWASGLVDPLSLHNAGMIATERLFADRGDLFAEGSPPTDRPISQPHENTPYATAGKPPRTAPYINDAASSAPAWPTRLTAGRDARWGIGSRREIGIGGGRCERRQSRKADKSGKSLHRCNDGGTGRARLEL